MLCISSRYKVKFVNYIFLPHKIFEARGIAMLGFMRKNAGSWIIKLILGVIAVVFVVSFGSTSFFSYSSTAIEVNGEEISVEQLQKLIALRSQEMQRGNYSSDANQIVTRQAQQELIRQALMLQAAARMGISAASEEVRQYIINSIPAFQQNGHFDFNLYQQVLAGNKISAEEFESDVRKTIIINKLITILQGSVRVSPRELQQYISLAITKVEGAYVLFQSKDYRDEVALSDEEKQLYYQQHAAEYMEPEYFSCAYLLFAPEQFMAAADIDEEDISLAYERNLDRFRQPDYIKARFINLTIPPRAGSEARRTVLEKANAIAREAEKVDFEALADKYGQDPSGIDGKLRTFNRGSFDPEIEDRLFAAQPGQLMVVQTDGGMAVCKVESYNPASFIPLEQVRQQLIQELKTDKSKEAARQQANQALADLRQGKSIEEIAANLRLKVENTPLLSINTDLPNLPASKEIWESLRGLKAGQAGLPLQSAGGVILPVLLQHIDAAPKTFEQAQAEIEQTLRQIKASQMAAAVAGDLIKELTAAPDPRQAILGKPGVRRTGLLAANQEIPDLAGSEMLTASLFMTSEQTPALSQPIAVRDGLAVAVLLLRAAPSQEEINAQEENYQQLLLTQKRQDALSLFIQDLSSKAEIKIRN
jgi:peptidyl-prolyl cis-trans isomerase D